MAQDDFQCARKAPFWRWRLRGGIAASELDARKDRRGTTALKEIADRKATLGFLDHKLCNAFKNPNELPAAMG